MPARKDKSDRKDKVIQTRVNERLDDALKEEAARRRLPVSQLIRNVLEDTFALVGNVVDNVDSITQEAIGLGRQAASDARAMGRRRRDPGDLSRVHGWQPIVVNKEQACTSCGQALVRGDDAFIGLTEEGLPGPWLCATCRGAL